MIQTTKKFLLAVLLCLTLALAIPLNACIPQLPINQSERTSTVQIPNDLSFNDFTELLFAHEVSESTLTLNHTVADPAKLGIEVPAPTFGQYSFEAYQEDDDYYNAYLEVLSSYDYDELSANQQLVYEQIKQALEVTLAAENYFYYFEPLKPSVGEQAMLPLDLIEFNFRTEADIDTYLELLNDLPRHFGQLAKHQQEKARLGTLMPSEAMQEVLSDTLGFTGDATTHILVSSFNDKLASDEEPFISLDQAKRQDYQNRNLQAVSESVIPAYDQLYIDLKEVAKSCKPGVSMASYKRGSDFYQIEMQALGFSQTPTEAAATLDTELEEYWDIIAYSTTSMFQSENNIKQAVAQIADSPEAILEFLNQNYLTEFPDLGQVDYTIKAAPEETPNDLALAFYIIPPVDNPGQNTIYYFPDNISSKPDFYTTLAHEGIPGHLYQSNLFSKQQPLDIQVLLENLAYMEGWAMYAQNASLYFLDTPAANAEVSAAYSNFMYGLYARVDIGVNYQGWDTAAVQRYLANWQMDDAASELYLTSIKQPTAYLPYGLGVIEFNQLRQRAESALGSSFDPISFHQQLLNNSGLPFTILEPKLEEWLQNHI
jgi:uncharacterized protein (DUF885 family)